PTGLWAGQRVQLRHALALVHAARLRPDLVVRAAEQRVEVVAVDGADLFWRRVHRHAAEEGRGVVELRGLPGLEALGDLLGKHRGVGRGTKGLGRDDRRRLVVLTAAARVIPDETDDDVGPNRTNPPHVVAEDE